jgi:uncharacterized cupin superfamily protein
MNDSRSAHPVAVCAADVPPRRTPSNYPEPFASRMSGRSKRALGAVFGLDHFGVNLTELAPGMCAGFRAGSGDAHQLHNPTDEPVVYLEIGDRSPDDRVVYPDDDLAAELRQGRWVFRHKDGRPY